MADISLRVAGGTIGGWTEVTYRDALDSLSPELELAHVDLGAAPAPFVDRFVRAGDAFEAFVGGELLFAGFVDAATVRYSASSHSLEVRARSRTADLIDCSAVQKSWAGATISKIANVLCAPYGIRVSVALGADEGAPFARFATEVGETIFDALNRAARMRGLLLRSSPRGDLVIGSPRVVSGSRLQLGLNILEAEFSDDVSQRYSDYACVAQIEGTSEAFGSSAANIRATSRDPSVRTRALTLQVEGESAGILKKRALWEARSRASKSRGYTVTVLGWHRADGTLWRPGLMVDVVDPWASIEQALLVTKVELSKGLTGTKARLELKGEHAYDPEPLAPAKPKSGGLDQ